MADHSAVAIANEFLARRESDSWPQQMLVQKLAYIANGWNLAINGEPLIDEVPIAWDNGPVYKSIWDHIKEYGYGAPNCSLISPVTKKPVKEALSPSETDIVNHVWKKYGHMSASRLSAMTHEPETPWSKAYFGRGRNSALDNDEIKDHYVALAMAGRAAS